MCWTCYEQPCAHINTNRQTDIYTYTDSCKNMYWHICIYTDRYAIVYILIHCCDPTLRSETFSARLGALSIQIRKNWFNNRTVQRLQSLGQQHALKWQPQHLAFVEVITWALCLVALYKLSYFVNLATKRDFEFLRFARALRLPNGARASAKKRTRRVQYFSVRDTNGFRSRENKSISTQLTWICALC